MKLSNSRIMDHNKAKIDVIVSLVCRKWHNLNKILYCHSCKLHCIRESQVLQISCYNRPLASILKILIVSNKHKLDWICFIQCRKRYFAYHINKTVCNVLLINDINPNYVLRISLHLRLFRPKHELTLFRFCALPKEINLLFFLYASV